jgi:hypothetical protein
MRLLIHAILSVGLAAALAGCGGSKKEDATPASNEAAPPAEEGAPAEGEAQPGAEGPGQEGQAQEPKKEEGGGGW